MTIKRSVYDYPLHTAKLYGLSEYVGRVLPKSNKILFFLFLFLVFLQDKIEEYIMSIILGQSPIQEYKVTPLKIKSVLYSVGSTTIKFFMYFVTIT